MYRCLCSRGNVEECVGLGASTVRENVKHSTTIGFSVVEGKYIRTWDSRTWDIRGEIILME